MAGAVIYGAVVRPTAAQGLVNGVAADANTAIAVQMCTAPELCAGERVFNVPAGQRLVIEQVSGWCWISPFMLRVRLNGQSFTHFFVPSSTFQTITRIYADESVELLPPSQGNGRGCGITLSGHLVPTGP
jgi:hypothetical protein